MGDMFLSGEIIAAIGPVIASRWRHVATEQTFNLRAPRQHAPDILVAAASVVSRRDLAQLVLAIHPALNVPVPPLILSGWPTIANQTRPSGERHPRKPVVWLAA